MGENVDGFVWLEAHFAASLSKWLLQKCSPDYPLDYKFLLLNSTRIPQSSTHSSHLKTVSESSVNKRFTLVSRLPVELSCVETMIPLHSAIASARLRSCLSIESQKWGLVPQGISMPL
ncbi:protein NUCLEAR FUSION DEFECTIVE 6 [Forsythia ovata]|uniref:Protein NUCLEAR FUSION DEFECTIVE 6 n=1 Tax=Forsythia ovata TaxID=205694 RepID=A0ABD1X052_9LAMI